jgi:hypothetical protein
MFSLKMLYLKKYLKYFFKAYVKNSIEIVKTCSYLFLFNRELKVMGLGMGLGWDWNSYFNF